MTTLQWSWKLFLVCQTKCPAGLQCSAGHLKPLPDIFTGWWLAILVFPSMYWTLPDKMSGSAWALCQTSQELCRTCPACPAYFAITALYIAWFISEIYVWKLPCLIHLQIFKKNLSQIPYFLIYASLKICRYWVIVSIKSVSTRHLAHILYRVYLRHIS